MVDSPLTPPTQQSYSPLSGFSVDQAPPSQNVTQVNRTAAMASISDHSVDALHLMDQYQQTLDTYKQQIAQFGDDGVRTQAAVREQQNQFNGAVSVLRDAGPTMDPAVGRGAAMAAQAAVMQSTDQFKEYALEKQAVEQIQNLAAVGNQTQATVMYNNLYNGNPDDVVRNMSIKRAIMQREIEKAQVAVDNQGWFSDAADFLAGWLPLKTSAGQIGDVPVADGLKHWYDGLFSGQRVRNESDALWNMDHAEFAQYVRDRLIPAIKDNSTMLGLEGKTQELNTLVKLNSPSPTWAENASNAVDNLGMVPFTKIGKGAMMIPKLLIRNGAREATENMFASSAIKAATEGSIDLEAKTGLGMQDIENGMLPKALNTGDTVGTVGIAMDAGTRFQRGMDLIDQTIGKFGLQGQRLQSGELQAAMTDLIKQTYDKFGFTLIKDVDFGALTSAESNGQKLVDIGQTRLANGSLVHNISMVIGKDLESGGFSTADEAIGRARSLGYDPDIIRDESGQYFFKVTESLPETGFYTNPLKTKATMLASRALLSNQAIGDEWLQGEALKAGSKQQRVIKMMNKAVKEGFSPLSTDQRNTVGQLLAYGQNEKKWFGRSDANLLYQRTVGRDITDREWKAYTTSVNVNDMEYALRNDDAFMSRSIRGLKGVSLDTDLVNVDNHNGWVTDAKPSDKWVFDVSREVHYNKMNPLTDGMWENMKGEGYRMVTLEQPVKFADGTEMKTFVAKGSDIRMGELSRVQLPYSAGGHRFYDAGGYFVKQTSLGTNPMTGEQYLKNPWTFITGTAAETKFYAETMEQARQVVKAGGTEADLDTKVFKGHAGFPTGKQFLEGIEDGTYSKDHEFMSLGDREMPPEYARGTYDKYWVDNGVTAYDDYLRTNGRMYNSPKGDNLPDWLGAQAPTLDPYKALNASLMNIAKMSSFSDYKVASVERWIENYGKWFDLDPKASSMTQFQQASDKSLLNFVPERIKQAALGEREVIQRNLGWRTDWDLQKQQVSSDFRNWVLGDTPGTWRHDTMNKMFRWWDTNDPVAHIRGYAFDAKLGLFNVGQFPLQVGTMVAATSVEPTLGMHGMFVLPALRSYLTKAGTENVLDQWVKRGMPKLAGFSSDEEFKQFMRLSKESGFFDIGGTHQLINNFGPDSTLSSFSAGVQNAREAGRFFFNEGEVWNRTVAMRIAWGKAAQEFPELTVGSPEFMNRVMHKAEDFSWRMSGQSKAAWQSGLLSIPTQFWAYNARMMEMMVGKDLNATQKARLWLGQSVLYGSAGVPLLPFITERLKSANAPNMADQGSELDHFWTALDRGGLDVLMHAATGDDVQYGKRYGTGNWIPDIVDSLFGWSQYGQKDPIEVLGGASASIGSQTLQGLLNVARYSAAESGGGDASGSLLRDNLVHLASNISTVNNSLRAYMMFKYGELLSAKGTVVAKDLPKVDGWGVMLGFQPGEVDTMSAMTSWKQNRDQSIKDAVKVVSDYRQRWANEPDKRPEIEGEINLFTKMLPDEIRGDVLRKAQHVHDPSINDKVTRQILQDRYRDMMVEQQSEQQQ